MRQAGRYMVEYREMRARVTFQELCRSPELVAETTVFAQETIGADAAIVFSDLLLILEAMGQELNYPTGGPKLGSPVRTAADVDRLKVADVDSDLAYVWEGIAATRAGLKDDVPLIGFSGAPWTLAAYACEGGGSRNFIHAKGLMYRDPGAWAALMDKLVEGLVPYLVGQVKAGAQVLQVFDSWIGALGPDDYTTFAKPWTSKLIGAVKEECPNTPIIHFGTGSATLLDQMKDAGGDVIGVDFHTDFAWARDLLGDTPAQGNLDPILLLAEPDYLCERAQQIVDANAGRPGHVFNLGHGILPPTPVDNVKRLIEYVHEATSV